jgi:hypothetical protein
VQLKYGLNLLQIASEDHCKIHIAGWTHYSSEVTRPCTLGISTTQIAELSIEEASGGKKQPKGQKPEEGLGELC